MAKHRTHSITFKRRYTIPPPLIPARSPVQRTAFISTGDRQPCASIAVERPKPRLQYASRAGILSKPQTLGVLRRLTRGLTFIIAVYR